MSSCYLAFNGNEKVLSEMNQGGEKRQSGNIETQIAQALIKNGLYVQRELNQACQQFGLNTNQFTVLNEIVSKGPLSQKALCERLLFEKSNTSKIVKALLGRKLINVTPAPGDRRLTLLIDTPEGVDLWRACMQTFSRSCLDLLSSLKKQEIPDIIKLLKKLEHEFRIRSND